jgi:glycerophosphoryl diester phosphodiesterase
MIRIAAAAIRRAWRVWPQLVAADLATRVAATLLIAPAVAFVVQKALARAGGGALTDQDILWFVLSPAGLLLVLLVGAASALAGLVGHTAIMTVLAGSVEDRALSWLDGLKHAGKRFLSIFEMAFAGLVRLLLDAAPFLVLAGGAYLLLLREFDINYYLTARPPNFWIAGAIIAVSLAGIAWFAGRRLLSWSVALPRLLFGGASPTGALSDSRAVAGDRLWQVFLLFLLWGGATVAVSFVLTGGAAFLGRALVPEGSTNLTVMVSAVTVAVVVGTLANLVVSVVSSLTLAAFLFELDRVWSEPWVLPREVAADTPVLGERASLHIPGWAWIIVLVLVPAGVLVLTLTTFDSVEVDTDAEITAHRGASGRAPENTLAAVRAAIADSADWVEIDVQETSDGVVVVHHDADFMRAAGDARNVWTTTWAEIARIPNGAWFGPEFEGERVTTLEEVLRVARGRINVNIELKVYGHGQRLEERTIELVEAMGMADDVALMSLDRPTVQTLDSLRPDWTVGMLAAVSIGDLSQVDGDFLAVNAQTASPGFIRRAHSAGKAVLVWTVNHPAQMASVVSAGADGIITDEPAMAREVLAQLGDLSPVERFLLAMGSRFGVVPGADDSSEVSEA